MRKNTILVVTACYLPGYKGGGPIRSIANLVELLGDELNFLILTADRDLDEIAPYPTLTPNTWQTVGKAQVKYLSPDQMTLRSWSRHLRQTEYDLIYLNTFFAPQIRQILLLRRLGAIPRRPVVLAARGGLSPGALRLKSFKKRVYIQTTFRLGLYEDITWHAASESEFSAIQKTLTQFIPDITNRIVLASNLTAVPSGALVLEPSGMKQADSVRVVFLSRVARSKNLRFALIALQGLEQDVTFDIYGPQEDLDYWKECQQIIQTLPSNIRVTYCGAVAPDQVPHVLSRYHLFFFPTLSENFGHVIVEAWAAGLPVLISDQTPWRNLKRKGIGWDLPLTDLNPFQDVLQQVIAMEQSEYSAWTVRSKEFAASLTKRQFDTDLQTYRQLFHV